jgi:N-acetylglucosaminyldiphosphoundecaprenol N-acetyl-beta-D-mannosaminyltransferase
LEYSKILGIEVACVSRTELLEQVRDWVSTALPGKGQVRTLSYVNAHCLNILSQDRDYLNHLRSFDLVYPDGIGAVWAGRWLDGRRLYKITGADWIFQFCELAQALGWGVYILGGKPGVAQKAEENLVSKFPTLRVLGARDGYFTASDMDGVIDEIAATRPDVLFVGLGVPLQETWIAQWKLQLPVKICWAVGALFDYVAGVEPRAPAWMRRFGLEWFWRLLVDPSGKWKRYLLGNPTFFAHVARQKFRG